MYDNTTSLIGSAVGSVDVCDATPVSIGLHVLQGGEHGLHPEGTGADVGSVGEVVVTERLLKLTQHLLEVGKVVVSLWRVNNSGS